MKLASMKMSAEERKEQMPATASGTQEQYPYGLRLDVNDDALAKLGMKTLPKAGSKLLLFAHVEVVSKGTNQEKGGDEEAHLGLQITEMALAEPEVKDPASKLYK